MPGSFQATRTSELLLDLICILDPGHAHERLPRAVAQYGGMLKNHKYLSVMEKDVEKSFAGVCEKLALSGRGKETAVLKLSKEKFLERHAYAKDMCIASDLTDGTGFPVPQAMVKLLMCLANAPTAVGKHVPLDQLMDAERALAQPVLPVGLGESSDEEEEDVLGYDQWREQCALEDSDDEQDESWVLEEACSEVTGIPSFHRIISSDPTYNTNICVLLLIRGKADRRCWCTYRTTALSFRNRFGEFPGGRE